MTRNAVSPERSPKTPPVQPFLKWPGGKRWFIHHYSHLIPQRFNRFIEPFLGAGAVFFCLQPEIAILGDANDELMSLYRAIKKDWKRFHTALRRHDRNHSQAHYYDVRDSMPRSLFERAARTLYLNRTCFNGIYRVNRAGHFNVPKGTKNSVLLPTDDFANVARLLANARLHTGDFGTLISSARRGDLVFADPPYTVQHNQNAFIKYNEHLFSWADQCRLAHLLAAARDRGVRILATNADTRCVRSLYDDLGFKLTRAKRLSVMSANAAHRKKYSELVITGS
jgi:DNA adenine methylase